jgi:tetratricopeptide (TPR) repeat protein
MATTETPPVVGRPAAFWLLVGVWLLAVACGRPAFSAGVARPEMGAPSGCTGKYFNYMLAQQEERRGNWNEAVKFLRKAIACDPDSSYLHRELAMVHVHQKDLPGAMQVLEALLARHPTDVDGWMLMGRIQQQTGAPAAARSSLEKALALDPERRDAYLLLGHLYLGDENWPAAQAIFEQFVNRFPEAVAGHFFLARIYEAQGRFTDALAAYQRCIELDPSEEEARYALIRLYQEMGRDDEVIDHYQVLLDGNPHNARAGLALALHYHERGLGEQAADLMARFARRSLDDEEVIGVLVRFYLDDAADPQQARILLEGMLAVVPGQSDLHYLAGIVYNRMETDDEAIAHFTQVEPDSQFYEEAVAQLAYLYQKHQRTTEAIDCISEAIQQRPENTDFRLYLGGFYEELERYAEAEKTLLEALSLEAENIKLLFRLGVIYDKWGRRPESIERMKQVIDLDPRHTNALNYLGYTYAEMGVHLDEAEQLIQQALALKPDDGYITDSLGWVYFKQGRYQEALSLLERASRLAPEDPVILEHVGDAHRRLGQIQEAIDFYRQALDRKETDREPLIDKLRELGADVP